MLAAAITVDVAVVEEARSTPRAKCPASASMSAAVELDGKWRYVIYVYILLLCIEYLHFYHIYLITL